MPPLKRGTKYRVTYRLGGQRADRESVMVYLGANDYGEYQFSARPEAGTQTLPVRAVIAVRPTNDSAPCYVDRRLPNP